MAADAPAPIVFVVPGQRLDGPTRDGSPAVPPLPPAGLRGRVSAQVRIGLQRGEGSMQRLSALPGQDLVVLEIENGPSLVLHPQTARDLMLGQSTKYRGPTRGGPDDADALPAAPGEVEVPAQLRWQGLERSASTRGSATRGFLGDVLLRGVQIVSGHLVGQVEAQAQQLAARAIAARIDGKVGNAVYALQPDRLGALKAETSVVQMPAAADGRPTLVLLHGTFSDTPGTFGKLWAMHPQRVRALFDFYRGRVFALDHPTLGASPIENALTLARACAPGARLHLVSHSRGGLVAEVLARACGAAAAGAAPQAVLDAATLEIFDGDALARDREALAELLRTVAAKRLVVERLVRVACPARGTLLASGRLDAYLSIFKWSLELAGLPVLPELVDFLGGVAQCRLDPTILPGVAAMVPDSPLVTWLHAAPEAVPGQLRVVAGDLQGDSIGSWCKTLLADAFYWTDNDLVVQTRSMYGGAPRAAGASFVLDQGGSTSHFNYFANEVTAEAIVNGLIQDAPDGWRLIGPLSWAGESAGGTRGFFGPDGDGQPASERPCTFVLPGILGSHLALDGKRIWLGWRLINGLARLKLPDDPQHPVRPDGAIGLVYDDLIDHLRSLGHEVVEFSYDWRLPIEQEARRLGAALAAALDARARSGQPVRIVAHSMGGLVTRTMQLECDDVWQRWMAAPGSRLLMLGTPNGGSWAPMQCLSGDDSFGNTLVSFGAPFQDHAARDLMAQFPGFLQLQAGLRDAALQLASEATWQKLADDDLAEVQRWNWWHRDERQLNAYRWGVPRQPVLDAARRLRERLDAQRDALAAAPWRARLLLVVGEADFTPDGYVLGERGLEYLNAPQSGDGRVPLESAMLPGVATWKLGCDHGKLPSQKAAFEAFVELLEKGQTDRLPRQPEAAGATRGEGAAASAPAAARVRSRPSRERLAAVPPQSPSEVGRLGGGAAFGSGDEAAVAGALPVSVHNADLSFVRQPLMLGHYISLSLTGTEAVVDRLIGGTMSQSLAMGQYPDQPGTHQIFTNQGSAPGGNPLQLPRPEAAIVVGLGEEGKLRGADLVKTVRLATLAWAQRMLEQPGSAPASFELAATLMASGGSGISAGQAAQLIAQGVRSANEALAGRGAAPGRGRAAPPWPQCSRLHLMELYLDRASEAWRALKQQEQAAPRHYRIDAEVRSGTGAMRRPPDFGYRGASYDFISATAELQGDGGTTIAYTVDTRRARSEVRAVAAQLPLLKTLVQQGAHDRNRDPQIGRTLFQLLVPVELEPFFAGSSEMLLELDGGTAGIPWELLDTDGGRNGGGDRRPWALRAKLLRKLRTSEFRAQPQDAGADAQALVIGEPHAPEGWARLEGARLEARRVCERLQSVLGPERVASLIAPDEPSLFGPEPLAVINLLMARPWRIVHLSGHGQKPELLGDPPRRPGDPPQRIGNPRGVVLNDGAFLGPREIQAMRTVPELVFINCCHLGATGTTGLGTADGAARDPAGFAAGVAQALIEIGVRCVVAAGWAVDDGPAAEFAGRFYDAVLAGERFIDAVAQARQAAWEAMPEGQTWAAYQCYGDPEWRLRRDRADAQAPVASLADEFAAVASPPGLAVALESLAIRSRHQGAKRQAQQARIRHLEARFGPLWGGIGAVAEAFAVAWDAAGDRAAAVEWYRRALAANDGSASLKATEQYGNLSARLAWDRREADADAAAKALDDALALLRQVCALQPTMERESLLGSALKRRAMLLAVAGEDAAPALAEMKSVYARALERGRAAGLPGLFYPALNLVAAGLATGEAPADDVVALARQSLLAQSRDEPDFWSVAGLAELRVYEALAAGTLAAELDSVLAEYRALHDRVPGSSGWRSVSEHFSFLLPLATAAAAAAQRQAGEALAAVLKGYAKAG